jgi:hypothetical protein
MALKYKQKLFDKFLVRLKLGFLRTNSNQHEIISAKYSVQEVFEHETFGFETGTY